MQKLNEEKKLINFRLKNGSQHTTVIIKNRVRITHVLIDKISERGLQIIKKLTAQRKNRKREKTLWEYYPNVILTRGKTIFFNVPPDFDPLSD